MKKDERLVMNIVNQLFDLAEVPVKKRQEINDTADAFVLNLLRKNIPQCSLCESVCCKGDCFR